MDPSYNNSFGDFTPEQVGGVYSQADGEKKRFGKKIWIFAIIGVVLLAGLLFFAFMKKSSTSKTTKQALNEYSNYLLYGEDSNSGDVTEKDWWSIAYFVDKMLYDEGNFDLEYFTKLADKYIIFNDIFSKEYDSEKFENSEDYELLTSLIEGNKDMLEEIKSFSGESSSNRQQTKEMANGVINTSVWIYRIINDKESSNEK